MSTTPTARLVSSVDIDKRVGAVDWASVSTHLDGYGWAMLRKLLTADECETIAGLYEDDRRFRSHVVMGATASGEVNTSTSPIHCRTSSPSFARRCIRGWRQSPITGTSR
jgi:hypothetical protein